MIPVNLARLANDCDGILGKRGVFAQDIATGTVIDNRQVSPGDVFVALRGERTNGNAYAGQSLEAGAVAVLTSEPDAARKSGADPERLIVVEDVKQALGDLARANLVRVRELGKILVVGVTGSVGKTTTKDLLYSLLAYRGPIIAPPGSFNNEIGLPLTVLRAGQDTATLVLEMGADHIGNIDYLTSIAPPNVGVVLAVGHAHVGEFGGLENVCKAKSELVKGLAPGGVAVLNVGDPRVRTMVDLAQGSIATFSVNGEAHIRAENVSVDKDGHPTFTLVTSHYRKRVTLGLVGEHHVANALAAATVAWILGRSLEDIAASLEGTKPASPHRMDVFSVSGVRVIDDSYNANPDSMRAGLAAAAHVGCGQRLIAVLGEMLELGEESAREHAALGRVVHECGVRILITVGKGTAPLADDAASRGVEVYRAGETEEALTLLNSLMAPGDVVLLKGSHGSGVWSIADELRKEQMAC